MRRLAFFALPVALLMVSCGAKSSGSTDTASTAPSTTAKPAGAGLPTTTKAKPPACAAADRLGYDFLVAEKAKSKTPAEKAQIIGAIQKHAGELKAAAPQIAASVDARVTYQSANLNGNATADQKTKNDQGEKDIAAWYKQTCK